MSEANVPRITRRWDLYGWAVISVLMALFILAAVIGLDAVLPIMITPAFVIFLLSFCHCSSNGQ